MKSCCRPGRQRESLFQETHVLLAARVGEVKLSALPTQRGCHGVPSVGGGSREQGEDFGCPALLLLLCLGSPI